MLTNLDFLKIGSVWPPPGEKIRLDKYRKNKMIFEGEHEKVYQEGQACTGKRQARLGIQLLEGRWNYD